VGGGLGKKLGSFGKKRETKVPVPKSRRARVLFTKGGSKASSGTGESFLHSAILQTYLLRKRGGKVCLFWEDKGFSSHTTRARNMGKEGRGRGEGETRST